MTYISLSLGPPKIQYNLKRLGRNVNLHHLYGAISASVAIPLSLEWTDDALTRDPSLSSTGRHGNRRYGYRFLDNAVCHARRKSAQCGASIRGMHACKPVCTDRPSRHSVQLCLEQLDTSVTSWFIHCSSEYRLENIIS